MVLANVIHREDFNSAYEFLQSRDWTKIKECFGDDISEIDNSKEEDKCLALFDHLNSLDWSDEEIINHILKKEKKKWFVTYNDRNEDFSLYEVKE